MKTLKYILTALIQFFKSSNSKTKTNTIDQGNIELTYTKFGLHSKQDSSKSKTSNSLLSQLYSDENETLFI